MRWQWGLIAMVALLAAPFVAAWLAFPSDAALQLRAERKIADELRPAQAKLADSLNALARAEGFERAPDVTLAEFMAVKVGDSLHGAEQTIGRAGTLIGEGREPFAHTATYQFQNADGGVALLVFTNGRLSHKSQSGLR